jgi:hypothetical protein
VPETVGDVQEAVRGPQEGKRSGQGGFEGRTAVSTGAAASHSEQPSGGIEAADTPLHGFGEINVSVGVEGETSGRREIGGERRGSLGELTEVASSGHASDRAGGADANDA